MITNFGLATFNALCNTAALTCVVLGARAIKQRQFLVHKRWMLRAFGLSLLFLSTYFTRILMFGDQHFAGQGNVRYVYFALLISHVVLAVLIAPAVAYTVWLGMRGERPRHKRLAPKVLPVWIYVLATGVLVYLFVYQWWA